MRAHQFITESKTTLNKLYDGNFPDRDELFWDYVGTGEFDSPLEIQTLPQQKLAILLRSQYRVEHLDELLDMMDHDQRAVLKRYRRDPALSSKIIVLSGDRIIDGNHRALAAAMAGVPINYVDLQNLDDQNVKEDISRRSMLGGLLGAGALGAAGVATKNAMDTRDDDEQEHQREIQKLRVKQTVTEKSQLFDPKQYRPLLEKLAQNHGITSIRDMSNFLGQVEVETRSWATPVESLRYSTPQLIHKTFKSKFPTVRSAAPYVNNPVALANRAYAGVNGNGDEDSGDGWRYRGRGFKQITGRANYAMVGRWAHPDNPDIYVDDPDLLSTNPRESALASIAFYLKRVKLGSTPQQASRRTNPGGMKKDERRRAMDKIQRELEKQRNPAKKPLREVGRNAAFSDDDESSDYKQYSLVPGLKPVPQNPQYAYSSRVNKNSGFDYPGRQADLIFGFYHIKDGLARHIGIMTLKNTAPRGLRAAFRNTMQVNSVWLDKNFRNWGVGMMMYGVVLGLGYTIVADDTQTPDARRLWVRLSQQPNVSVRGVMEVTRHTLEEMDDPDYIPYDSEERQLQRLLKRSDTQFITDPTRPQDRYDDWELLSFAVRPRADGAELEAPGISIYKKHERNDGWDPVGLYATLRTQA